MVAPENPASFSGRTTTVSRKGNSYTVLPPEEARVRGIAEIVNVLIQGVKDGKDVDLNQLKTEVCGPCCQGSQHGRLSMDALHGAFGWMHASSPIPVGICIAHFQTYLSMQHKASSYPLC